MSNRLPSLGWRRIVKALGKKGLYVIHQKGSHIYMTDQQRKHKVTVPRHETVAAGTLLSIIEQSGMMRGEFLRLLD
ncbi:MAG: type II toxin-antitoxin system HicA family toxin [Nitrososphaerales archaeon]